jgi:hypothetical protein
MISCALTAIPTHTVILQQHLSARDVRKDQNHHPTILEQRHAHLVEQVLTLISDLRALHAWLGPMLLLLDRLSAQNVLRDHHQQLAHFHATSAHNVQQGHTTLQADLRARSAWLGHTPQLLDCLSV